MSDTNCVKCASPFPKPPPEGGASGYATLADGTRICYPCADVGERTVMLQTDRFVAYLSSDGKTVTTWTGGELGTVSRTRSFRMFGRYRKLAIRVIAFDGSRWHARGASEGLVCMLRRCKGRK